MLYKKILGVDFGTDNVRVYLKGKGIIIDQPSMVAFNNRTNRVVASGGRAKEMLDRTPSHITAMRPVMNGVIADFDMAKEMVRTIMNHQDMPWSFITDVIVTIPTNLTEVERKSVVDLFMETGAHQVHLLPQPLAAALSSHLEVYEPSAYLIVDIGAGAIDMAVISMGGIVMSRRMKLGGSRINADIGKGVRDVLRLEIGEPTAEFIKVHAGSAKPSNGEQHKEISIRGRDTTTGLPREETVKSSTVREWIMPSLRKVIETVKNLIEATPPELVGDIYKNGCYLCGGGSLLSGIDEFLGRNLGLKIQIMEEPLTAVARGSGVVAEHFDKYRESLEGPARMSDA